MILRVALPLAMLSGLLAGCGRAVEQAEVNAEGLPPRIETDVLAVEKPVWERLENGEPGDEEVYFVARRLIRSTVNRPIDFVNSSTDRTRNSSGVSWWVMGLLDHEDGSGTRRSENFSLLVRWDPESDAFSTDQIRVGDEWVYKSAAQRERDERIPLEIGNSLNAPPEHVAKEVRNVQAAIDDAIKSKTRQPFEVQWPDDPARPELRVQLNSDGFWAATGKFVRYDGSPRSDLFALVVQHTYEVKVVRVGKSFMYGKAFFEELEREKFPPIDDEIGQDPNKFPPPIKDKPVEQTIPEIVDPPSAGVLASTEKESSSSPTSLDPEEVAAAEQFAIAEKMIRQKRLPSARAKLQTIVADFPKTKAAKEAKKLLGKSAQKKRS